MDAAVVPAAEAAEPDEDDVSTDGSLPGRVLQTLGGIITKQEIGSFADSQLEPFGTLGGSERPPEFEIHDRVLTFEEAIAHDAEVQENFAAGVGSLVERPSPEVGDIIVLQKQEYRAYRKRFSARLGNTETVFHLRSQKQFSFVVKEVEHTGSR